METDGMAFLIKNKMKRIINTTNAPAPIGPYNQAVMANGFLFLSGQVAINPETGGLTQSSITEETHQVMRNIKAVLLEASYGFEDVVKTTIFLSDMALFAEVNEVYGSYFETDFPARETVAVKGLPKGVNVEISMTAYKG
ncbi:2-iminobutanoate/2-iminopropanoate deaminase [Pedobacter africanus]